MALCLPSVSKPFYKPRKRRKLDVHVSERVKRKRLLARLHDEISAERVQDLVLQRALTIHQNRTAEPDATWFKTLGLRVTNHVRWMTHESVERPQAVVKFVDQIARHVNTRALRAALESQFGDDYSVLEARHVIERDVKAKKARYDLMKALCHCPDVVGFARDNYTWRYRLVAWHSKCQWACLRVHSVPPQYVYFRNGNQVGTSTVDPLKHWNEAVTPNRVKTWWYPDKYLARIEPFLAFAEAEDCPDSPAHVLWARGDANVVDVIKAFVM